MKKISILGAGESGTGAALLAKSRGYTVFVSDAGEITAHRKALLTGHQIEFEEGGHSPGRLLDSDEMIKSPGIPFENELVRQALERGIPVIDELEFAARYSQGKVIAITGTNGKTTTSLLTFHLLQKAGIDVGLAGNVGESWAAQLLKGDHAWWVLEVSSFQIDGFKQLKPHVAILINISPDHLDRYGYSMNRYIQAKMNLLKPMDESGHIIFFNEDGNIRKGLEAMGAPAQKHQVSLKETVGDGAYYDQNSIKLNLEGKGFAVSADEIVLTGTHNMINAMCALSAALIAGAGEAALREGLRDFKNAPHRMERVEEINGVLFVNDSKGTNVEATAFALAAYQAPVVWIAGGVDKGNDYSQLYRWTDNHVKALVCLGKDNEKLKNAFRERIGDITETQDMVEGIREAFKRSNHGDVVLLSPACASFDLFKNYEDRGEQFKAAVKNLKIEVQ